MISSTPEVFVCECFAGGNYGGDRLQSDCAGRDVPHVHSAVERAVEHKTYVDVHVSGPTPAGNCFHVIRVLLLLLHLCQLAHKASL